MKPNNFPVRASLDGTEELYTQTNDVSEKFTLDDVKAFSSQNLSDVLINGNSSGTNDIVFDASQGLMFNNGSLFREGTTDAGFGGAKGVAQICSIGYELKWEAGRLYVMEQGGVQIRQSLYNQTNTPGSNDDDTKGYIVGSLWTLDNGVTYICTDNTSGFAVWSIYSPLTLENVLNAGNTSPDGQSLLDVIDGQSTLKWDNGTNIFTKVSANDTDARLEHSTSPSQTQKIYVDADSCNMSYADGINIIDVELGLTNGFRAYTDWGNGDYENFIQIKFDKINLHYKDPIVNRQIIIDTDGIYFDGIDAYDDNAAAVAAGLTAGYVFQTTGSGAITTPGVVCIVQ